MTRARPARQLHAAALALLLAAGASLPGAGCDRVGGALVDHRERRVEEGVAPVPCNRPPACEDPVPEYPDTRPRANRRVDIGETCALQLRSDCHLPGQEEDAGVAPALSGCLLPVSARALGAYDRGSISCSRLVIGVTADDPGATRLDGVEWEHLNVSLVSTTPFVLELEAASLDDVAIEIDGPITLRIASSQLTGVRISSTSPAAQQRVELVQVDGERLRIGDETAFAGTVAITRATLAEVQLVAHDVRLESVELDGDLIEAAALLAVDSALLSLVLESDDASLSVCRLEDVRVRACGMLTLIGCEVERSALPPCRVQPLRVYSTKVIGGLVDGVIESDRSNWEALRLGLRAPTDLVMWDGAMLSTSLCAQTRSARFGASASVRCSACSDDVPSATCVETTFPPELDANWCPALEMPAACTEPLERPRPLTSD